MAKNVALVTGGMGGLGTAICKSLAKDGWKVVANCLPDFPPKDEWLAAMKAEGFEVFAGEADVTNYEQCAAMVAKIEAEIGQIDCVVNTVPATRSSGATPTCAASSAYAGVRRALTSGGPTPVTSARKSADAATAPPSASRSDVTASP